MTIEEYQTLSNKTDIGHGLLQTIKTMDSNIEILSKVNIDRIRVSVGFTNASTSDIQIPEELINNFKGVLIGLFMSNKQNLELMFKKL